MVIGSVGGAIVGTILGAIKGQTTETGFLKGAGIGGLTGAIAAIQLLDSAVDGEPLSKVIALATVMCISARKTVCHFQG